MRRLLLVCTCLAFSVGAACGDPKDPPVSTPTENRLAQERSPYLRQHRLNPVDWYPWGEEALERAKREDKPIFLSVGYAACHWCHVMEHESFEDEETARLLNAAFVCVKVDREERPDLDRVYMTAVQVSSQGSGGWPMTVILTPDTKPFFARTYLAKSQLQQVTTQIRTLWREDRAQLVGYADSLAEAIARSVGEGDLPATDDSDAEIFRTLRDKLEATFDRQHGGYGSRPKFPPHAKLLYDLRGGGERMDEEDRLRTFQTLDAMARGGIHDQVGGGFHRYSTDAHWLLPHFEKMLYDNALLAQAYARAYALTQDVRYRRVVERLFGWLEREMARPGGGYASSLDADTEGEEGLTYTWTGGQLRAVLSAEDAAFFETLFGFEAQGNFADEATGRRNGQNIPHWTMSLGELSDARRVEPAVLTTKIDGLLHSLRESRDKRPQPGLDDKVITGWNGLLVSAFAHAGTDLSAPDYLERARTLATFLLQSCRREDGTLLRFPRGSGPEIPAFCEDYVHLIDGLLALADATGQARWQAAAEDLATRLDAEFQDPQSGGFFATSSAQHETLIARAKESFDSPIPSDNGVAARVNLLLHARTGGAAWRAAADRTLSVFRPQMASSRMAPGVVALIDALRLRAELDEARGETVERGEGHGRRGVVAADIYLARAAVAPGSSVAVLVRVHVDAGWHVNAHAPAPDFGVPTSLALVGDGPLGLGDVVYPPGAERRLGPLGEAPVALYEGRFDIRAVLQVPADLSPSQQRVRFSLRVQACDESSCREPATLEIDVPVRVAESDGSPTHERLFPEAK
jgi:uncharacterized protein YyaL (SSP411 family)